MADHTDHSQVDYAATNRFFKGEAAFVRQAMASRDLPEGKHAEIAFAGRSNVGKSSLLNAIAGRKLLARTSRQPGRTQGLIFFSVRDCLTLVDMPGYGYAKAPKSTIAGWTRLSDAYLRGRTCLKLVLVLIDARRGIGASDHALMGRLDGWAVAFMPVLTKIDCIPAAHLDQLETRCCELMKDHPAGAACAVMTSAKKCLGIDRLRHIICLRGGLKSSQPKNGSARVN